MPPRWVTFDCFGTLVDWHSGFAAILRPLTGNKAGELLRAYHRIEPQVEVERPFRLYKEVLIIALVRAARETGVMLTEAQARLLPAQWATLPVFPDVEPALAALRAAGYKSGVLTNCDDDLFTQTQRSFRTPFDLVVTAERVRDYKPSPSHFRFFSEATGASVVNWVHVGCSYFHDIVPARQLGLKRIWLDRDRTPDDPTAASVRILSAAELPAAVARLFEVST